MAQMKWYPIDDVFEEVTKEIVYKKLVSALA